MPTNTNISLRSLMKKSAIKAIKHCVPEWRSKQKELYQLLFQLQNKYNKPEFIKYLHDHSLSGFDISEVRLLLKTEADKSISKRRQHNIQRHQHTMMVTEARMHRRLQQDSQEQNSQSIGRRVPSLPLQATLRSRHLIESQPSSIAIIDPDPAEPQWKMEMKQRIKKKQNAKRTRTNLSVEDTLSILNGTAPGMELRDGKRLHSEYQKCR